jgi:hypothetical protein
MWDSVFLENTNKSEESQLPKTCFELRAALERHYIRQTWMAELCGVNRLQVWRWCEGLAPIPNYVWTILAMIAGKTHHDILRGELPAWEVEKRHVYRNAKNFKSLAKRFHPDTSGADTTAEMQLINKFRKG